MRSDKPKLKSKLYKATTIAVAIVVALLSIIYY
ncbi:MAG: hypothetical protein ACI8QQ_001755 [Psychroserpens sp.]|jgi:hypothetical protein